MELQDQPWPSHEVVDEVIRRSCEYLGVTRYYLFRYVFKLSFVHDGYRYSTGARRPSPADPTAGVSD